MAGNDLIYKRKILKQLYFKNNLSCADLSRQIKKSFPIATRMLNELIEEGYVSESGYAPSSGGRRPLTYSLKPDFLYLVAVAMDQFITRIVIMDLENRNVCAVEKYDLPLSNNPQALAELADKINEVVLHSGIDKGKLAGIGIGMPGFVDSRKGLNFSFLETDGKSITEFLAAATGLPVFIDNDSRLIALAELRFGRARRKKDAMVVNIGWGIGLGLILNGELFKGHRGFAGEFSHIPLFSNNKLCSCGKSGCLETEASLKVVVEKAREGVAQGRATMLREMLSENLENAAESVILAAEKGDKFAVELVSEAGYSIGRGLAILIHLVNPELIILSGRGSLAGKLWLAPIQQALNEHCIPRLAANTEIEVSSLGHKAELIGAAALVMEHYDHFEPVINKAERELAL